MFGALVLLVGTIVVVAVAYGIHVNAPGPTQVGTATITISGHARFSGVVGTDTENYTFEATAPATVKVPYSGADLVVANVDTPSGNVSILVRGEVVEEGEGTLLVWKPPRSAR